MLGVPVLAAFLAAVPCAFATYGSSTSSFERCTTQLNTKPFPTGMDVPTSYEFDVYTQSFTVTSTVQETFTVAPSVTTCPGIMTTTSTALVTHVTTPTAITIPTPIGFIPVIAGAAPEGLRHRSPGPHARRLVGKTLELGKYGIKRPISDGNTAGLAILPDGNTKNLLELFPSRVDCLSLRTLDYTYTVTVTAEPTTIERMTSSPDVAPWSTSTVINSVTVTKEAPTQPVYAACQGNNVVNHIDVKGTRMNFDRVVYGPEQGLLENESVVDTTNAVNCCVACHSTPQCAGSFYVPSAQQCYMRLLGSPVTNTLAINGALTSGTETATPGENSICTSGSDSFNTGTIGVTNSSIVSDEFAMSFSNGPCGRFSIDPRMLGPDGEEISAD